MTEMKNFRHLAYTALLYLFFIIILFIFYFFRGIFVPFLAAYVFAFILRPPVNFLRRRGFSNNLAASLVFCVSFVLFGFILFLFLSSAFREISNIQQNMHVYTSSFISAYNNFKTLLAERFAPLSSLLGGRNLTDGFSSYISNYLSDLFHNVSSHVFSLFSFVMYLVIIPFAVFFFLLDEHKIKNAFISFVPNKYFEVSLKILFGLNKQFGNLLTGMLISVVIFSINSSFGLWIIGLKYPILLGFLAGLFNLIPYLGLLAGILSAFAVCVATGGDSSLYIYIVIIFFLVNVIDNTLVQPLVMSKSADIHPLLVMFIVLVGSKFGGVFGMFLAVPFYSLFQVVFRIVHSEFKKNPRPDFSLYKVHADT